MNDRTRERHGRAAFFFLISITYFLPAWPLKMGVENISQPSFKALLSNHAHAPRVGLISNQTARDQSGNRTVDILKKEGVRIVYILAPEHGFDGSAPAGKPIADSVDQATSIPIVSVYGRGGDHTISGKRIDPLILKQLDALIYDIQDSGMRHYTYISTLLCALEAAAESHKPIYILDRPNLLGGYMEGPLVEPELKSFISIASIPLRHGMTVGELARYFNSYVIVKPASLHVIPMEQYNRIMQVPFLHALSPNLASKESIYGYSFLGLLGEVKPFHVGVGSSDAFQLVMLPDALQFPKAAWKECTKLLQKYGISCQFHTAYKSNEPYSGLRLRFTNGARFSSFDVLITVLTFFKKQGIRLTFSPVFDKAVGTKRFRQWFQGMSGMGQMIDTIRTELKDFHAKAKNCFLYHPHPNIKT